MFRSFCYPNLHQHFSNLFILSKIPIIFFLALLIPRILRLLYCFFISFILPAVLAVNLSDLSQTHYTH